MTLRGLDAFTQGYLDAMFWTEAEECEGLDVSDLAPHALAKVVGICATFQHQHEGLLSDAYALNPDYSEERAGHDLWLTSNGHGAGYWDRGLGLIGDELTQAAQGLGVYVYRGDNGKLYVHGDSLSRLSA